MVQCSAQTIRMIGFGYYFNDVNPNHSNIDENCL